MTIRNTSVTTFTLSVTAVLQNADIRNECMTKRNTLVTASLLSVTGVLQNANMRNTLVTVYQQVVIGVIR